MATVAATGLSAKKKKKGRSIWWKLHHWAGLQLSLFLTFILATGTIATLSHEIDWLLTPAMRVSVQDSPQASWGDWAQSAHTVSDGARIEWLYAPTEPWFAAEAVMMRPDGHRFRAQINPWSAQVQGLSPWFNAQRVFRETHRNLLLPTAIGVPIVGSLAFPLLLSVITAFWVYKKWWRGFFRIPKRKPQRRNDGRRFTGDLHRFIGLWSLWFALLIGSTGLWYFIEKTGGAAPAPRPAEMLAPAQVTGLHLDALVTRAQQQFPELDIKAVGFPKGKSGGVIVVGQATAFLVRDRVNAVMLDPSDDRVVKTVKGETLSVHQRIAEAADPLHFGTWGGLTTKIIWFLFGIALTGLAVTGVLIYALRLRQEIRSERSPRILWSMLRGMSVMAWPCLALLCLALALLATKLIGM
ncbi:PepSY domain-containing protein [Altericroceibacterium spongiae]|uniref:PepSY domain-containing protein n=1 Tax=Altericroceibacterium spongiae TaxID=2320269 RepID=A0A420EAB5_9SPHN|nr:PepSY-associated TM helix domain-containing protein [Altericroceibacterium spongiae]RKF17619.1 PepSY domain-containing protein [Altericroceibacterium spongiae]